MQWEKYSPFHKWCERVVQVHSSACSCPVYPTPFMKGAVFFPLHILSFCSLIDHKHLGLYWALQCVLLVCVSTFVLILYCFCYHSVLCWVLVAVWAFLWCGEQGLLSRGVQTSHCSGSSCCGACLPGHTGFSNYGTWAQYTWLMVSRV